MKAHGCLAGFLEAGWASVASDAHRTRNEDAFFVAAERGFLGVFDGMGAHAHADRAAWIACREVQEVLAPLAPEATAEAVADTLRDAFVAADEAVRAASLAAQDPRGMGTTGVAAVLRVVGPTAWAAVFAWAGDSRALLHPEGSRIVHTLTLDDSAVRLRTRSLAHARRVQSSLGSVASDRSFSLLERDLFLERHVLIQSLGGSLRTVHLMEHSLDLGDRLLLVSDGVTDNLTDGEIAAILRRQWSPRVVAGSLVAAAQARSRDRAHVRAKPDDITAIVVAGRSSGRKHESG